MHLNELAVGVGNSLLKDRRLRRAGADDRIRALAEDSPDAAGCQNYGVGGEAAQLHRAQVECGNAAGDALRVDHGGEKLPALEFADLAFRLIAAHLLIESVEQLLAGCCAGKGGALIECPTETAEIQQTFRRAIEGHAHAVEQVDNRRGGLAHRLHRRLVGQKIAAVNGVVEVLPGGVALALEVFGGVDAALRANRVRALDRHDGEEVNRAAGLGDLDDRRKPGEAPANDDDSGCCHCLSIPFVRTTGISGQWSGVSQQTPKCSPSP